MTTIYLCEQHNIATVVGPAAVGSCERCEVIRLRNALDAIDLIVNGPRVEGRRVMKIPKAAWLVWFHGPPIDGFRQGPFMEWFWTKTAATKRVKLITDRGGGGEVLGCYERATTSAPTKGEP